MIPTDMVAIIETELALLAAAEQERLGDAEERLLDWKNGPYDQRLPTISPLLAPRVRAYFERDDHGLGREARDRLLEHAAGQAMGHAPADAQLAALARGIFQQATAKLAWRLAYERRASVGQVATDARLYDEAERMMAEGRAPEDLLGDAELEVLSAWLSVEVPAGGNGGPAR